MRRHALSIGCLAALLCAACSSILGDFGTGGSDGGSQATSDAGKDASRDGSQEKGDGASGSEASTGGVTAVATGETVYVGLTATVDGSKSTGASGKITYGWTFVTVPAASQVADSSLSSKTSAKPTFVPDVVGNYTLKLTVTSGATKATADATVTAVAPQVFYLEGSTQASGGFNTTADASASLAYYAVNYDGTNTRAVMCPDLYSGGNLDLPGILPFYAGLGIDVWEGEAGEPPKYAGFTYIPYDGGAGGPTIAMHLRSGSSASSCASPPVDLGVFPEELTPPSGGYGYALSPRFNADGSRVAIYDQHLNVVTLASDGSGLNIVAPYFQDDDASAAAVYDPNAWGEPTPPSPQWSGSNVAWARPTATGWQIVTAPDTAGASVSEYMSCTGVTPREFQFLSDGTVVASYRKTTTGPENIYLLSKTCGVIRTYTNLTDSSTSVATDFSVSPNGQWLAFLQIDPAVQDAAPWEGDLPGGYVYLAPINGSAPATKLTNDPALDGPRWIGGGSLLVFTRLGSTPDGGSFPATSAIVLTVDGGGTQPVATGNGNSSVVATGGSGACSISGRAAGPGAFTLFSIAAAAHFVRRRKRRAISP